jgi:branched-subunit amino acid transport protein
MLNTFMVYPNIFHDIPNSLHTAMDFMKVASPHTYFPPLGFFSWVTGVLAIAFSWNYKNARVLIIVSVWMMFAEGAASVIWEWPRNEIMFIEGTAIHSAEVLQQTYNEFILVHWFRVLCNIAGSILIFFGFLRVYRAGDGPSK